MSPFRRLFFDKFHESRRMPCEWGILSKRSVFMAISSASITRSSVLSGLNSNSTTCATCGKSASATNNTYTKGYSGRDSYVCATCNKSGSTSTGTTRNTTSSTYGRSTNNSSSYCPTCNKTVSSSNHSSTAHWTGNASSSTSKSAGIANSVSWAR